MEADAGDKSSRFRCLNAARYVVAAVVTVLIVIISLNTAKLVLYDRSHDPVNLSVAKSIVYVRRTAATTTRPPALIFYLAVRVASDRGFKYYANITTACLFNVSVWLHTPDSESAAVICFDDPVPGRIVKAVEQEAGHFFLMEAKATRDAMKHHPHYFDALYNNGSNLREVTTLLVTGTFIAEPRSGRNITSRNTITYSCKGLFIVREGDGQVAVLDPGYDRLCVLKNGPQPI